MSDPIVDQIILPKCPEQEGVTPITDEIIKNAIRVQEKDRFFVLPANSTQEQIVLALRELKQTGFVADGPPGTGKSQLIVNIIADSLALGKKVLVSCEKRAALDVVYKRLQGAGLIDHVLLLHSPEKERDKIFQIILDTIEKSERLVEGKAKKLKQQFEELANDVEAENKYLNEYHDELSKERANGLPLFEMYSRALTKNTELILNPELCEKYSFKEFKLLINRITSIFIDAKKYYALKMPTSIKIADSMGYAQIPSLLNEIKKLQDLFQSYTNKRHVVEEYRLKDVLDVEAVERKKNTFSEGLLSLNKLDKNDLVFKLMEGKLSVNQVEEKILTLKSIVEYLPEDFIELPVSFDSVDQECETISKYKNLLLEAYNKIYPSYQYYKKYSSKISNHTLFNKLTHYRLTPLFQEDTLEIFKYIESNKELLLNLSGE